jgi:hypothetical protein
LDRTVTTKTVTSTSVTPTSTDHPSTRPRRTWQGRLAVMASRGETTGPRVDECRRALAFYRLTEAVAAEVERGIIPSERADELVEHLTAVMT